MTQHVSPLASPSCCPCACGGAASPTRDLGFGGLLDALTTRPISSESRSGGGGLGVGNWFGFMDPLANFQLKQMLQDLRASIDLERRLKERIDEATKAADPAKTPPNRFADTAKAKPASAKAPAATPATPATPARPATPATRSVPATPATPAVHATPATPASPRNDAPHRIVEVKQHGHEPRKPRFTSSPSTPPRPAAAPKEGAAGDDHARCHGSAG